MDFPNEVFPKSWLNSEVPVIFDFCGISTTEQDKIKNILWCLLPQKDVPRTIVFGLGKRDFVQIRLRMVGLDIEINKANKNTEHTTWGDRCTTIP